MRASLVKVPDGSGGGEPALERLAVEPAVHRSRSDMVYRPLRERLMRGRLKPHERLRIRDLAQALSTSETPVREAIFQLVRDGAIELKPHHYVRVRRLTLAEYLEARDIRLTLEPLAAERALAHIAEGDVGRLAKVHRRLIEAERAGDHATAILANFDFHFGIYRRSGMMQLMGVLENLWTQLGPMLNYLYPDGHPTYDGPHQHELVLAALERRDARALKKAIRNDMIEGGRNFVRVLKALEAQP